MSLLDAQLCYGDKEMEAQEISPFGLSSGVNFLITVWM